MSKIKSLALLSAMMFSTMGNNKFNNEYIEEKETPEEKEDRLQRAERDRKLKQGLTEYLFAEGSLYALNEKSAIKKALKKNWSVLTITDL